jgi:hypothetical protein
MVDLIEKKNPETVVKQLFQDLFCGDNRIRTDDLLHAMQAL